MSEELDHLGEEGVTIPTDPNMSPEPRSTVRSQTAVGEVSLEMHHSCSDARIQREGNSEATGTES